MPSHVRPNSKCAGARVAGNRYDAVIHFDFLKQIPAKPEALAKFIDDSVVDIPDPTVKQQAIDRMRAGLIIDKANDDTAKIEKLWPKCEEASSKVPQAEFDKKHAAFLRDLVCNATESRGAIAKGIIGNWILGLEDRPAFSAQLARGLLGEDGEPCAATKDLDEDDVKTLRAAIARAPSPRASTVSVPAPPAAAAPAPPSAAPAPNAAPAATAAPSPAPSQASQK
jgi:hypothetical protein